MNRFKEFFIDFSTGKFSMSRLCLGLANVAGCTAALYLAYIGQGEWSAAIIAGIAASDAGVYFGSTRKPTRDVDGPML